MRCSVQSSLYLRLEKLQPCLGMLVLPRGYRVLPLEPMLGRWKYLSVTEQNFSTCLVNVRRAEREKQVRGDNQLRTGFEQRLVSIRRLQNDDLEIHKFSMNTEYVILLGDSSLCLIVYYLDTKIGN